MTAPTTATILAALRAIHEADQQTRWDRLLTSAKYALLVGAALVLPGLVVAVGVMGR